MSAGTARAYPRYASDSAASSRTRLWLRLVEQHLHQWKRRSPASMRNPSHSPCGRMTAMRIRIVQCLDERRNRGQCCPKTPVSALSPTIRLSRSACRRAAASPQLCRKHPQSRGPAPPVRACTILHSDRARCLAAMNRFLLSPALLFEGGAQRPLSRLQKANAFREPAFVASSQINRSYWEVRVLYFVVLAVRGLFNGPQPRLIRSPHSTPSVMVSPSGYPYSATDDSCAAVYAAGFRPPPSRDGCPRTGSGVAETIP
jgi:hypothetical protein